MLVSVGRSLVLSLGLSLLGSASSDAGPMYTVTDLGTLPGTTQSEALGINSSGQVVGVAYNTTPDASDAQAFLYSNGIMTPITPIGGGPARAINDSGQVVGGPYFAINNLGQYVGGRGPNGGNAVNSGGVITDIGTFVPTDINDVGTVVGVANPFGIFNHVAIIKNGNIQYLGTQSGIAEAVNNVGDVLATLAGQPTGSTILYRSDGVPLNLANLTGGQGKIGSALNDRDLIVGNGFLYTDGQIFDLNTLIPSNAGWNLTFAAGINNAGQIAGVGTIGGQQHAFLLNPQAVPEPTTWVFYGVAALAELFRRGRKWKS